MLRLPPMAALVAALALAAPAAAQTRDSIEALAPGRHAYSFTAHDLKNGGHATLGLWRVVAPDRARGLLLDVNTLVSRNTLDQNGVSGPASTAASIAVDLGPHFRRYVAMAAPVAPFVETGFDVGVRYESLSTEGAGSVHDLTPTVGGQVAAGAEWFALRRVSLSAQTGLVANLAYLHGGTNTTTSPVSRNGWSAGLTTFVSALTVQIYF